MDYPADLCRSLYVMEDMLLEYRFVLLVERLYLGVVEYSNGASHGMFLPAGWIIRKRRRVHLSVQCLLDRQNVDCRDGPFRVHHHALDHLLEIPEQAIDRAGREKMRLVDASPPQAMCSIVQCQYNIETCRRHQRQHSVRSGLLDGEPACRCRLRPQRRI